ncbi:peptidase, partial [Streptomyces sp. SID8455]|nr:peptidase [Streptomyces sp. SID8455]
MHRPISPSDPGPAPADGSPRPELANALAGARRRAQRDGDGQTDTAHLLHALLEHDPASREAVDAGEQGGEQLVKLLGLLVQRNIGYGLKWHGSVEDSGALPVARSDGWSPAAAEALDIARRRA